MRGGRDQTELLSLFVSVIRLVPGRDTMRRMWLAKLAPTRRRPNEDVVEWAQKATWTFTVWKCKIYGLLVGINVSFMIIISAGMPGHFLWQWFGIPLIIVFAYVFAALLFYAAKPYLRLSIIGEGSSR